jgi:hypothetical protein
MPAPFANGTTVTRQRGTAVDDGYGGSRIDWTSPAELEIEGCALAPRQESEAHGAGRAGVIVGLTLYAPYDADIAFTDRISTPSGVYEIEGEPGNWLNPFTGTEHGLTAALRRVDA